MPETKKQCSDMLPGHKHCVHGHVSDCPDPGFCEIIDYPKKEANGGQSIPTNS